MIVRPLAPGEEEQSWNLGLLAFGAPRDTPMSTPRPAGRYVGAFDDTGRLIAKATGRPYEQWWCGRPVPMLGIAGVAVHPDGRGQGLVRQLLDALLEDEPISVLFPTAPGVYRGLGWEIVGQLDDTVVPLSALPRSTGPVRSATPADVPAIAALYSARGQAGSGLLTRTGPSFPGGAERILDLEIVSVVEQDGRLTGYVSYDRGEGYRGDAQLRVWDCLAADPVAYRALLGSLASWDAVAATARWRGSTRELALSLDKAVPPPLSTTPWMLRVLDPVAAVAARGFTGSGSGLFALDDRGYRLEVADGKGQLLPVDGSGLPRLTPQGLALLYSGTGRDLHRLGLADRPVPDLESLWAGPPPEMLDYF